MNIRVEQFSADKPNPMLSVEKDGYVLYSNEAGEYLLKEWGTEIKGKLPSNIKNLVQRVLSRKSPEKMEVKAGKRVYLVVFHPEHDSEYVSISGFDISDQKEFEQKILEREARYRDVFETVQEVFYIDRLIYDDQGNVIDWIFEDMNPAGFKLLGLKDIDEVRGKRGTEVLGQEITAFYIPMIEEARRSDKAVTFQYRSPFVDRDFLTSYIVRGDRLISTRRDITERKEIEKNLQESEARCKVSEAIEAEQRRLYDVLETLPVMISLLTSDHRIAFANQSFREKFGESKDRHCFEFRYKRTKPCEFCEAFKVLKTRKSHKWEVTIPDGSVLEVYYLPFTDVDGSPMILEMDIDITERKKAEEKLRESEEKYRNIVETSNEGIYFVNDEGKVIFANRMMETSGYGLDEIIGSPVWNFVPEESLPVAKKEFEKRLRGISGSYELKLIRKDGSYIWGHITAKPFFNKKGKFKGYLAMMADITERKEAEEKLQESEEKYRNIVETANEGILTTEKENIITYVNNKVVDTIGYPLEEIIGRSIWGFISEEYRPIVKQRLENRGQEISENYELKLIHKNGSPIWAFLNAKPLFDKDGNYMGAISMLTDITQRKTAEEALASIEAARKKEIHHRIKNNLQVISSLLDLQADQFKGRKDIKDSEVLEAFRESQDRVISMALIHEELYKGGGFETLNFAPYIEELAEILLRTYSLGKTGISLRLDLAENIFFDMDTAVPLGMIVNELVSNSLKHAFPCRSEGEIRIKLFREENIEQIKRTNEKITSFALTVSDNGAGIPENFDIEDIDTLGMQLVSSLVDQLGGELELKRKNGTEFIIRFTVNEGGNEDKLQQ